MDEYAYEQSPLRAALEGFMDEITPSETLDPRRIVEKGRGRRRKRQFALMAGSAVAVLATAGSAYALSGGNHGNSATPAGGRTSATASTTVKKSASAPAVVKTTASAPAATGKSASALPGTPLTSGTTDGVAWKTSITLEDFQGAPDALVCLHVWTSDGSTNPAVCTVKAYPGYGGEGDTPEVVAGQPLAISAKLGVTTVSTMHATSVHITYAGGAFTLPTVDSGRQSATNTQQVTAVVLPLADTAPSGRVTPIGPGGTGMTTDLLIYATPTGR